MDVIRSKCLFINQFLHIPGDNNDIEQIINGFSYPDVEKSIIIDKIRDFVSYFAMFKDITPLMNSLHSCIKKTLEIKVESINEIDRLLVSNALLKYILDYVNYSKMNQKDTILNVLAESFEKLQVQPLILNLGLLVKPMYNDQVYLDKIKTLNDEEVAYILNDENEIKIKKQIDIWLDAQELKLDNQKELKMRLIDEFDRINMTDRRNISRESKGYKNLLADVIEMMALKLTVISLMESIPEESCEPIPIK